MQYPVEVPGVSVSNFLRTAKTAIDGEAPKLRTWVKDVNAAMERLNMDPTFAQRIVNEGFSGGEKKRHEIVQLELLDPKVAVLDETDSGLDIDALKIVSEGVNRFREREGKGVLLITHYTRILRYIKPDFVHVFVDGRIAEQGGPELADQLEAEGYDKYLKAERPEPPARDRRTPKETTMEGLLPELDVIRKDFPILERTLAGGLPLVYLDSANTSQKPQVVIDTMVDHLERHNANVARAMHQLGAESTEAFEAARDKVAAFLNAPSRDEVIFTKNASEALNLVANTLAWARTDCGRSPATRSSSPRWSTTPTSCRGSCLTERTGATLRWFGLTDDGRLDLSNIDELINERTKVVSLTWVSNMLGTINPVAEIAAPAHEVGALVVVDASQAAPQLPVDVAGGRAPTSWPSPATRWSARPASACSGAGASCSTQLPPFLGGGEMIETVTMERSTYAEVPHRFEAGTPPIVEAVGLGAAVDYLGHLGMDDDPRATSRRSPAYALEGLADRRRA